MEMDDVDRLVMLAREWYPNWSPTPITADAWYPVIGHHPYPVVAEAMKQQLIAGHYGSPDIGAVARLLMPQGEDVSEVIAVCDRWYRGTDDIQRLPTRAQRDQHPLAAMCWDIAGGYDALHDRAWAHQRLRKAYEEAAPVMEQRGQQAALGHARAAIEPEMRKMLDGVGKGVE